jgi:hypothetical protein
MEEQSRPHKAIADLSGAELNRAIFETFSDAEIASILVDDDAAINEKDDPEFERDRG